MTVMMFTRGEMVVVVVAYSLLPGPRSSLQDFAVDGGDVHSRGDGGGGDDAGYGGGDGDTF